MIAPVWANNFSNKKLRIKITLQYINIKLYRLNWYQKTEDEPTGSLINLTFLLKVIAKKGQASRAKTNKILDSILM